MDNATQKPESKKFLPESILNCNRIGLGGLGGGADIVNAIPLYMYLLSLGKHVTLISCHGRPMDFIYGGEKITTKAKWVDNNCQRGCGDRVFEHVLCQNIINMIEPIGFASYQTPKIAFVSRHAEVEGVARAFDIIVQQEKLDCLLLIDGGGDALECDGHYTSGTSHKGDSLVIEALRETLHIPTYVGIVACGIDTPKNWKSVLKEIKKQGGHAGIYDLVNLPKSILNPALEVMRASVKMSAKDESHVSPSLTCTTFWCSLIKHYKRISTQAHWKPTIDVVPEFSKLRILHADVLDEVKKTFLKNKYPQPSYNSYHNFWDRQEKALDDFSRNIRAEFEEKDIDEPEPVKKNSQKEKDLDEKQIQQDLKIEEESDQLAPGTRLHYKVSFWKWLSHHLKKVKE